MVTRNHWYSACTESCKTYWRYGLNTVCTQSRTVAFTALISISFKVMLDVEKSMKSSNVTALLARDQSHPSTGPHDASISPQLSNKAAVASPPTHRLHLPKHGGLVLMIVAALVAIIYGVT